MQKLPVPAFLLGLQASRKTKVSEVPYSCSERQPGICVALCTSKFEMTSRSCAAGPLPQHPRRHVTGLLCSGKAPASGPASLGASDLSCPLCSDAALPPAASLPGAGVPLRLTHLSGSEKAVVARPDRERPTGTGPTS